MSTTRETQIQFKEREDGIVEYCGGVEIPEGDPDASEWGVVEAWQGLDASKDESTWTQGSIAALVTPVYGKETMKTFGLRVGHTPQHLKRIARTYIHFTQNEPRGCFPKIFFQHHLIAMRHPEPGAAIALAAEHGWSTRQLEEWVIRQNAKAAGVDLTDETLNALIKWNEHVEEIIEEDFIALCPEKQYANRVFKPWLEDLRGENKRLYLDDLREKVIDAIEKGGFRTIKQLVSATGVKQSNIEAVVYQLVDEEEYEWIERRGEGEDTRGKPGTFLYKFGSVRGDGYAPNYDPNISTRAWD